MNHSRGRALLLLLVLVLILVVGRPPDDTGLWNALYDAGHAILFAGVTWSVFLVSVQARPAAGEARHLLMSAIVSLIIGVLSELVQRGEPHRHASLGDLARDAAGITFFIAARLWRHRGGWGVSSAAFLVIASTSAAAVLAPVLLTLCVYLERNRLYPTLVEFNGQWWEATFLKPYMAEVTPGVPHAVGQLLARVDLAVGSYPGFSVVEPYPDWSRFERLVFGVFLTGSADLVLTIRVHDRTHNGQWDDRFNQDLMLLPGWQVVSVPLEAIANGAAARHLDLARIRGLSLYAYNARRPVTLYLSPIRLEGTRSQGR